MYDTIKALKLERRGSALWVTMDAPPLNGFTPDMHAEMAHVFREISRDPDVRVVVLTGGGERGFSAGGDIKRMLDNIDNHLQWISTMGEAREIILNILECDKPVIARVNGHAIGLGASIALACDITLMVETAKIADTHVAVGLVAGDGGSVLWPQIVGLMKAKKYLLSGDMMTGAQAAEIGLITEAMPREELDARVEHWADKLGNGASVAIALTKRALNMGVRQQAQVFMEAQLGFETMSHLSADHREAVTAFVEKREPRFTGK